MLMRGSQIVMECLLEQGVDTVFGYPGGTILNIYDEFDPAEPAEIEELEPGLWRVSGTADIQEVAEVIFPEEKNREFPLQEPC